MDKESKVKIFVGYFKPNTIFKSDVYQPILTSSIDWTDPDLIRDDTQINIAHKNKNYAELTGHYWVWKNFLPATEAEYIGFCHYRRFFDFNIHSMPNVPFKPIKDKDFKNIFPLYTEETILDCIKDYDVILPEKFRFEKDILSQYLEYHPPKDFSLFIEIIKQKYPQYLLETVKFIASKEMYPCLHFIMKKDLFNEYMGWMFGILQELEMKSDWSQNDKYSTVRMPAFLAERFFNVWVNHNVSSKKLKVLTTSSFILTGKDYGAVNYEQYTESYNVAAKSPLYRSKI